jgi:hypothetical protein
MKVNATWKRVGERNSMAFQKKRNVIGSHEQLQPRIRSRKGRIGAGDERKNNGDDFGRCAARRADAPSRSVAPRFENDELLAY